MKIDLLVNTTTVIAMILAILAIYLKKSNNSNSNVDTIPEVKTLNKGTGDKSIILLDAGVNKITVLATIRQILGIGLEASKRIIDNVPSTIIENVSEEEAKATKEALEFVGATVKIR